MKKVYRNIVFSNNIEKWVANIKSVNFQMVVA
jgi:hypothetical protein